MLASQLSRMIKEIPGLQESSTKVAQSIHQAVLSGGEPARRVADLLHGTWLGHPAHPMLTDIVVGAWSMSIILDGLAVAGDRQAMEDASDKLIMIGVLSAVPTAITGMADYSTIPKHAAPAGLLHALLNNVALGLYLLSWRERRSGRRGNGIILSTVAYLIVLASAWLGGELVYRHRVGVNHNEHRTQPDEWTDVMSADDLAEHEPERVEVEGYDVLLYRYGGTVYAISAVCAHAGGPLEKGKFDGFCVQCPWHDSVFDLRDGRVVHGPATYVQPKYATRIQDGRIEVRLQRTM
jgi:nitrite reductase/ring-hydroxylating ferredoxin subunit/uncharacterized membrane protein